MRRAAPRARARRSELPPPLAEPRLDCGSTAASAQSYEVRAGEYIQVIDVPGKQCSDFLAFHRGQARARTRARARRDRHAHADGQRLPGSRGCHGKFYDLDMDPLVEVVHDTVGRHDTFALACQAKYYEDLGYPGHVNCTDNFNGALRAVRDRARARVGRRSTSSTTRRSTRNMQLVADEPWSRPGDYVMVRALTDLVCASSACPDDIDPSNAWEVTDVHVRVYTPQNRFSLAIAHRVTADAEPVLTRETAFHSAHLGADQKLRRIPRLLAAALLQQRGRDRRVLGVPRAAWR